MGCFGEGEEKKLGAEMCRDEVRVLMGLCVMVDSFEEGKLMIFFIFKNL